MASSRDRTKISRASRRSHTLSGDGKPKTTGDIAIAYVEDVLCLTTQPSELAADRSRILFSDSLLVRNKHYYISIIVLYPDYSRAPVNKFTILKNYMITGFVGSPFLSHFP